MIELIALGREAGNEIAEACPSGKLSRAHCHELAPSVESAEFPARVVFFRECLEFMSRKYLEHLTYHRVRMRHSLNLLCFQWACGERIVTQRPDPGFLIYQLTGHP